LDAALADHSKAMEIHSRSTLAFCDRAILYLQPGHLCASPQDHSDESVPESVLAEVLLASGSLDGALQELDKKLLKSPRDAVLLTARGLARNAKGQPKEAKADLTAAIASDPKAVRAFVERARVLTTLEEAAAARRDWEEAIRLGTKAPDAYYSRGWVRIGESEYDEAIADFYRSLELSKGNNRQRAYAHKGCAMARYWKREYEAAVAEFTNALKLEPEDVWSLRGRGRARVLKEDARGALQDAEEAVRIDPDDLESVLVRGVARKATGDLKGAIEDYERLNQIAPRDWSSRLNVETNLKAWKVLAGSPLSVQDAIAGFIGKLSSKELGERLRASRELTRRGREALPALRKKVSSASGETALLIATLLARLEAGPEEIAARINDEPITWSQVKESFGNIVSTTDLTPALLTEQRKVVCEEILFWQFIDRKYINVSETELRETTERDVKLYGGPEEFEKTVRIRFGTLSKYRNERLLELAIAKLYRLIVGALALVPEAEFADLDLDSGVSLKQVRKYYDSHRAQFQGSERVSFFRIGMTFATADEEAQKRELAESLLRKLRKGAEFAMVVFFYSDVRRAKGFGDMSVSRQDLDGVYSSETIRYLFDIMKEGELSPIVKDGRSLNIFRMEQKVNQKGETLEGAEPKIRILLENQKREENRKKVIGRIRQLARIEPPDVFEEKK
jgi:tetratricopeptide (TPR) repeat protein